MLRSSFPVSSVLMALHGLLCAVLVAGCTGSALRHDPEASSLQRSTEHPGLICEMIQVPARDGKLLATRVYRADGTGNDPYPGVVSRSPYGRLFQSGCFTDGPFDVFAMNMAENGYAFVIQMVRGTYNSQGSLQLLAQERRDGHDLIEWVSGQDWSNGNIGLWGASYLGASAWQAALSNPPGLRAVMTSVTAEDYHREWAYVNGVPSLMLNLSWMESAFAADQLIRQGEQEGLSSEELDGIVAKRAATSAQDLFTKWAWHLPLSEMRYLKGLLPDYYRWLEHPYYDEFWDALNVEKGIPGVQVPALITGAWYDLFADGTIKSFLNMKQHAGSEAARRGTKLVMTPYGHSFDNGTPTFGPKLGLERHSEIALAFFDRYVKGIENDYDALSTVQISVMVPPDQGNEGHSFELQAAQFPPPGTQMRELFLASGGRANSRSGDGLLSPSPPSVRGSVADQFRYDPNNPVPTTGGNLCCGTQRFSGGPSSGAVDQALVEAREDVLVYTSAPLEEDWAIIGPISVQIFARSTVPDTDFTAKLVGVHPDGATHNIVDGIVRARLRAGSRSQPSFIEPNQVYEYTIELGNTATLIPIGHALRLQISSSNFPRFARNLNTGRSNENTAEIAIADQTILHDGDHPSKLILPVARGVDGMRRPVSPSEYREISIHTAGSLGMAQRGDWHEQEYHGGSRNHDRVGFGR